MQIKTEDETTRFDEAFNDLEWVGDKIRLRPRFTKFVRVVAFALFVLETLAGFVLGFMYAANLSTATATFLGGIYAGTLTLAGLAETQYQATKREEIKADAAKGGPLV